MRRRVCSSKAFKYGCKPFHIRLLPVLLHMVITLFAPSPKFCINRCFHMLLGGYWEYCIFPIAFEDNNLCKIWGANRVYYGGFENSQY